MALIAHVSDLHFPYTTPELRAGLLRALQDAHADLIVISGDLTQRARSQQFAQAQTFIEELPKPILVVPGNHDVPLYDLPRRFLAPVQRYREFICDDLTPTFRNDEFFVVGANSTRAFTFDPFGFWKNGSLSMRQLDELRDQFAHAAPHALKVLVVHHPLVNPWGKGTRDTIRGRSRILRALEEMAVDVVLSGHLHVGFTGAAPIMTPGGRRILCVLAGTACSTRLLKEAQAFNLVRWDSQTVTTTPQIWDGASFVGGESAQESVHK